MGKINALSSTSKYLPFLEVRPLNPSRATVLFLEGLHQLWGFLNESLQTDDVENEIVLFWRRSDSDLFFPSPEAGGANLSIVFHVVQSVGMFKLCSTRENENMVPQARKTAERKEKIARAVSLLCLVHLLSLPGDKHFSHTTGNLWIQRILFWQLWLIFGLGCSII